MTRWQVPVVIGAVAVGTLLGLTTDLDDRVDVVVIPALVGLLALTFAGIRPTSVGPSLRPHLGVAAASLGLNFLWAPSVAGVLGWLLLADHPDLRLGLIMLLVTPCTDWYLVFTAAARGNVMLGAALLPVNLVLQLALLPVFVVLLTGSGVEIEVLSLVSSVGLVVGLPLVVALATRVAAGRLGRIGAWETLVERAQPAGPAMLAVAITAIFAANAQLVVDEPGSVVRLVVPLAAFFVATYLLAGSTATFIGALSPERVVLTMTSLARNSPIALAIAAAAFPDRPLVVIALVAGPLLELPVLAVVARRLAPAAP